MSVDCRDLFCDTSLTGDNNSSMVETMAISFHEREAVTKPSSPSLPKGIASTGSTVFAHQINAILLSIGKEEIKIKTVCVA